VARWYENEVLQDEGDWCKESLDVGKILEALKQEGADQGDNERYVELSELSKEVVEKITEDRGNVLMMGRCDTKKRTQADWGLVLVERQRRRQDNGIPVLQRAMKLKQKKNLEQVKGNPFESLQYEKLHQIANDTHLKFGKDIEKIDSLLVAWLRKSRVALITLLRRTLKFFFPVILMLKMAM
jgi:hypothetical protein